MRSYWKPLLIVGTVFLVVVSAVLILVALNWSKLSGLYTESKTSFAALSSVQAALASKYDAQVHVVMMRTSGVSGSILSINIINSSSLRGLDYSSPEAREKALEIATTAHTHLPPNEAYDNYRVVIAEQEGQFIKTGRNVAFMFQANEISVTNAP